MLCACGCGVDAGLAVKGYARRFIYGHNMRLKNPGHRVDPETGCWLWLGRIRPDGYPGGIRFRGRMVGAHIAYFLRAGKRIPKGKQLDHVVCDNRGCVNPDHVEPATPAANRRRSKDVILSLSKAAEIRSRLATGERGKDLAQEFGVGEPSISNIKARRVWV